MVKGIAKYGFKSGVLPKTRQVVPRLKTRYEAAEAARVRTGFSDPAMVPKGSPANPPGRSYPSAEEKLAHSAKTPRTERSLDTAQKQWRAHSAEVRRQYLSEALKSEASREKARVKRIEIQHEEAAALREKMASVEDTPATILTMPTIEASLISGSMVVPRTDAEKEELSLKRKANLKRTQLQHAERRTTDLLELFQSTKDYIITEQELEQAVNKAFMSPSSSIPAAHINLLVPESVMVEKAQRVELRNSQNQLSQTLLGTTSTYDPGLGEVRDALDGSWQNWASARESKESTDSN